jgi:hypothetical protein
LYRIIDTILLNICENARLEEISSSIVGDILVSQSMEVKSCEFIHALIYDDDMILTRDDRTLSLYGCDNDNFNVKISKIIEDLNHQGLNKHRVFIPVLCCYFAWMLYIVDVDNGRARYTVYPENFDDPQPSLNDEKVKAVYLSSSLVLKKIYNVLSNKMIKFNYEFADVIITMEKMANLKSDFETSSLMICLTNTLGHLFDDNKERYINLIRDMIIHILNGENYAQYCINYLPHYHYIIDFCKFVVNYKYFPVIPDVRLNNHNLGYFANVLNKDIYVDKTQFIAYVDAHSFLLINRMEGMGKSVNCSMLETFYMENRRGHIPQGNTFLFLGTSIFTSELLSECGKVPVLAIDLNSLSNFNTLKEFYMRIRSKFIDALNLKHPYLFETERSEIQELIFRYKNGISDEKENKLFETYNLGYLKEMIKNIAKAIFLYFNKKIILLVDNYDMPVQASLTNTKLLNSTISTLNDIYSYISDLQSMYISKTILFGISNILNVELCNMYTLDTLISGNSSLYFGLTAIEIVQILMDKNYSEDEIMELVSKLKSHYNGYKVISNDIKEVLYTTTLVMNQFKNVFQNRQVSVAYPKHQKLVEILINAYVNSLTVPEYKVQKENLLKKNEPFLIDFQPGIDELYERNKQCFINTLLLDHGLITFKSLTPQVLQERQGQVVMPNITIYHIYKNALRTSIHEENTLFYKNHLKFMKIIYFAEAEEIQTFLNDYLSTFPSNYSIPTEKDYEIMLITILNQFNVQTTHSVKIQDSSNNKGRIDVLLIHKEDKEIFGIKGVNILFELKRATSRADVSVKFNEAKRQIEERDYLGLVENNDNIKMTKSNLVIVILVFLQREVFVFVKKAENFNSHEEYNYWKSRYCKYRFDKRAIKPDRFNLGKTLETMLGRKSERQRHSSN